MARDGRNDGGQSPGGGVEMMGRMEEDHRPMMWDVECFCRWSSEYLDITFVEESEVGMAEFMPNQKVLFELIVKVGLVNGWIR